MATDNLPGQARVRTIQPWCRYFVGETGAALKGFLEAREMATGYGGRVRGRPRGLRHRQHGPLRAGPRDGGRAPRGGGPGDTSRSVGGVHEGIRCPRRDLRPCPSPLLSVGRPLGCRRGADERLHLPGDLGGAAGEATAYLGVRTPNRLAPPGATFVSELSKVASDQLPPGAGNRAPAATEGVYRFGIYARKALAVTLEPLELSFKVKPGHLPIFICKDGSGWFSFQTEVGSHQAGPGGSFHCSAFVLDLGATLGPASTWVVYRITQWPAGDPYAIIEPPD